MQVAIPFQTVIHMDCSTGSPEAVVTPSLSEAAAKLRPAVITT
jgi:hypothetical protein